MDALISAAAAIQAAQIQANYTLLAAVVSSIIGAIGIIYAAWYAWQSGIKLHQHNNIIEAKREVYLDVIARYNQLVSEIQFVNIFPEKIFEILLNNNRDFFIAIEKVKLICDTPNKKIIDTFALNVGEEIHKIMPLVQIYIKKNKELESSIESCNDFFRANVDLEDIDIDAETLNKISLKNSVVNEIRNELLEHKNELRDGMDSMIENLDDLSTEFSRVLRSELKIEDNNA